MRDGGARERLRADAGVEVPVTAQVPAVADFMRRLMRDGMDIEAVWSVGHSADAEAPPMAKTVLLVFADGATLQRLRKSESLRDPEVSLLVVTDGDSFENAWGAQRIAGSLARWAWREVSAGQAYYDESRWAAAPDQAGNVVRVRRTARLLWRRAAELQPT